MSEMSRVADVRPCAQDAMGIGSAVGAIYLREVWLSGRASQRSLARKARVPVSTKLEGLILRLASAESCTRYSGALSPLFCQPALPDLSGSSASTLWECSHFGHSKVRRSEPAGPGSMRASDIRVWHFGQRGRSIALSNGSVG